MKIHCTDCGRQIVSYPVSNNYSVGGGYTTLSCGHTFICQECSVDLDENGLYPEEQSDARADTELGA